LQQFVLFFKFFGLFLLHELDFVLQPSVDFQIDAQQRKVVDEPDVLCILGWNGELLNKLAPVLDIVGE